MLMKHLTKSNTFIIEMLRKLAEDSFLKLLKGIYKNIQVISYLIVNHRGHAPNFLVYKMRCRPPQAQIADAEDSDVSPLLLGLFLLRHLQFFPPFWGWISLPSEGLNERLVSVGRLWALQPWILHFLP